METDIKIQLNSLKDFYSCVRKLFSKLCPANKKYLEVSKHNLYICMIWSQIYMNFEGKMLLDILKKLSQNMMVDFCLQTKQTLKTDIG